MAGIPASRLRRFSTAGGDPLVHLASNPVFMPNFPGWAFFKFNPWRARFDEEIRRHMEAGLVDLWKWRVWVHQKEDALIKVTTQLVTLHQGTNIAFEEPPAITALTLDDIQVQNQSFYEVLFSQPWLSSSLGSSSLSLSSSWNSSPRQSS